MSWLTVCTDVNLVPQLIGSAIGLTAGCVIVWWLYR